MKLITRDKKGVINMTKREYELLKELEKRLNDLEKLMTTDEYTTAKELQTEVSNRNHMFRIKHLVELLVFEEER
jgi:hypothetical protein